MLNRLEVLIHRDVLVGVRHAIAANPKVEVGGKLVGFIDRAASASAAPWPAGLRLRVVASIDPGPQAVRTATQLIPDGRYQADVLVRLRDQDPSLAFVGTWHSHHPNGFPTLSPGDLDSYRSTVADQRFENPFLFASLALDRRGLARHWLMLTDGTLLELPSVVPFEGANPWPDRVAVAREQALAARETRWFHTDAGRWRVAADQAALRSLGAAPVARLCDDSLEWSATLAGERELTLEYPREWPGGHVVVTLTDTTAGSACWVAVADDRPLLEVVEELATRVSASGSTLHASAAERVALQDT